MKKISILTLGCKVNQYESEALGIMFQKGKYEVFSEYKDNCDAYIINTCSVTNMSDRKSRQMIRKCINKNPKAYVAVMGCYSQGKTDEAKNIKGVSYVCGTSRKTEIYDNLISYFENKEENKREITDDGFDFPFVTDYNEKTRAIVKIQDGCNSFCSYCIIPYLRGRCRSRKTEDILSEMKSLSENGYKEIVLAGIHVCNYGIDLTDMTFPKLLSMIEEIEGIERIRLSSVEPLAFNDEFFSFYKTSKKLCPHFHISIQSGSDSVIKRMNRHYTGEYFLNISNKLREINPKTVITTDVIVGFPGETDDEFSETVSLLKKNCFLKIHTFKYSKRDGTVAAKMENQIPDEIKDKRSKEIIKISDYSEEKILNSYIGKTVEVLFEEKKGDFIFGFSENYLPVYAPYDEKLLGKIVKAKIEKIENLKAYAGLVY